MTSQIEKFAFYCLKANTYAMVMMWPSSMCLWHWWPLIGFSERHGRLKSLLSTWVCWLVCLFKKQHLFIIFQFLRLRAYSGLQRLKSTCRLGLYLHVDLWDLSKLIQAVGKARFLVVVGQRPRVFCWLSAWFPLTLWNLLWMPPPPQLRNTLSLTPCSASHFSAFFLYQSEKTLFF